ncbi:hypothetical protein MRX96_024560 [Rhipicephalus microplus]
MVSAPNQGPSVKEPAMHADERPGVAERRLYSGVAACESPLRLFWGATRVRRPQNGVGDASTAGRGARRPDCKRADDASEFEPAVLQPLRGKPQLTVVRMCAVAATSAWRHTTLQAFFFFYFPRVTLQTGARCAKRTSIATDRSKTTLHSLDDDTVVKC